MSRQPLKTVTYKTPRTGLRVLLCLLLGTLILGLSWQVRQRLGIAFPFSLTPGQTARPQESARKSRELTLEGHTLYALQLGAFTQESAARQLAQEFSARGAAGYVRFDGEAYRVFAAAYPTRAEAQTVQTRLSGQGISTYIHPCVQEALSLRAGGTDSQLDALREALGYLNGLPDKLYALSMGLDSRQTGEEECRAALLSEGVTCAALGRSLNGAFGGDLPGSLTPLAETLSKIAREAERTQNENSAARIGAALKTCQLTAFFGLLDFAEQLCAQ